ncbi:type II secretion system protein [Vibrio fluvialis]|uniref:type II secretion system protein n=1 Tax=Vibrio fluvialis TaxID=676 RepID=UPI001559EE13|nr:type II secretion system protein [Vibrio fluvialis]EKO3369667.1 type II secretion system protein [Vibrio fluvialis]EKO3370630.1 type II secretion system protein [Vibrio fluvialis]EKO3551070.1 type II secretion system protein [Vibrio fluvialis]EKO3553276.1 type II secretion system protein [Vibrio fluvialis]EKO3957857.1 type II secretion system protein [Vibrio fluvialis]
MKRQGGFTLIELVVVIVILGILAVTAAPRFLNLQGDAREASLQGLKGAMQGAAGIVYGKAAINGLETSSSATPVSAGSTTVNTIFGYPTASSDGIGNAVAGIADDWAVLSGGSTAAGGSISYTFNNSNKTQCFVTYSAPSSSGDEPRVSVTNDDC